MKYSQLDLLEEGFWDGFKNPKNKNPGIMNKLGKATRNIGKAARWGIRAAAKTLDHVAPEVTQPIHKFEAAGRDILGMRPADSKIFKQNLNAAGGTIEFQGKQYLLDLQKGVTPGRSGHYIMKANEVNKQGKKSHKIVSVEMDKDFNIYGIK